MAPPIIPASGWRAVVATVEDPDPASTTPIEIAELPTVAFELNLAEGSAEPWVFAHGELIRLADHLAAEPGRGAVVVAPDQNTAAIRRRAVDRARRALAEQKGAR